MTLWPPTMRRAEVRFETTDWTPLTEAEPQPSASLNNEDQPGFCIELAWNDARKFWQPFLVIKFWRWRLQIGWLY